MNIHVFLFNLISKIVSKSIFYQVLMHGVYTSPEDAQLSNQGSKTPLLSMVCNLDYIILHIVT